MKNGLKEIKWKHKVEIKWETKRNSEVGDSYNSNRDNNEKWLDID